MGVHPPLLAANPCQPEIVAKFSEPAIHPQPVNRRFPSSRPSTRLPPAAMLRTVEPMSGWRTSVPPRHRGIPAGSGASRGCQSVSADDTVHAGVGAFGRGPDGYGPEVCAREGSGDGPDERARELDRSIQGSPSPSGERARSGGLKGAKPAHSSTGRRGYRWKWESVRERSQSRNREPRRLVTARACRQPAQTPASAGVQPPAAPPLTRPSARARPPGGQPIRCGGRRSGRRRSAYTRWTG